MIFLTYLNFTLKSVNAFCVVTVLTIWQYKQATSTDTEMKGITFLYKITLRTLVSITDALNLCTIMYLFYFQGIQNRNADNSKSIKQKKEIVLAKAHSSINHNKAGDSVGTDVVNRLLYKHEGSQSIVQNQYHKSGNTSFYSNNNVTMFRTFIEDQAMAVQDTLEAHSSGSDDETETTTPTVAEGITNDMLI
ncbi:hypothetical protein FGO68_gene16581 [Halteria grandinella]|uniref:Uncharacterized protein n=1 Tax=Halteria grandinella TaxID=5974 RepID=A0A8J8NM73_HALGN|nr:hypothetical protein FGO68_gene16581 [Halteria grandinella]